MGVFTFFEIAQVVPNHAKHLNCCYSLKIGGALAGGFTKMH